MDEGCDKEGEEGEEEEEVPDVNDDAVQLVNVLLETVKLLLLTVVLPVNWATLLM